MTPANELHVESSRCIRCGACGALAPEVFEVMDVASRVRRAPAEDERKLVEAARLVCPTDAVRGAIGDGSIVAAGADVAGASAPLFDALAIGAERVRWSLGELPWDTLDAGRATPELRLVVREMAFSESATYSATQRFMEAFFDDVDFSKWLSVWFYEETRHPHVLFEWLRRVGEPAAGDFELKGRVSTPFMRSLFGTLVTNVVSEITAAQAYRRLAATSPEPVLALIARRIAGDEARHAATFFRFARRRLAAAAPEEARRDRARGLEVLQAWLGGAQPTTHPVAQMIQRLDASDTDHDALALDFAAVRTRVVRVIGLLLELPLHRQEDVGPALRDLLTQRGTS